MVSDVFRHDKIFASMRPAKQDALRKHRNVDGLDSSAILKTMQIHAKVEADYVGFLH